VRAPGRLGLYAVGLVAVLAAGAGIGAAVGPLRSDPATPGGHADTMSDEAAHDEAAHDEAADAGAGHDAMPAASTSRPAASTSRSAASELLPGLSASAAGYTLAADGTSFDAGVAMPFTFRVLGPDGNAVTTFEDRHERELHLVVVSSDLTDYQHLHPSRADDGTWGTTLLLPRAGTFRAYADFQATGEEPLTLATEIDAAGPFEVRSLPPASTTASVDGYEVRLDGRPGSGEAGELRFVVTHGGQRVTDLEPYLGAFGHLVAIRASDHAYLHVHPTDGSSPAEVAFAVEAPSPGAYRLFLDFQHHGVVRTAAFTVDVPAGGSAASAGTTDHGEEAGAPPPGVASWRDSHDDH
jgi:hypothetical protein